MMNMGRRWRAPKKVNNRAWHRIERGDIWWDTKHINRVALKNRNNLINLRLIRQKRRFNIDIERVRNEQLGRT